MDKSPMFDVMKLAAANPNAPWLFLVNMVANEQGMVTAAALESAKNIFKGHDVKSRSTKLLSRAYLHSSI
jgi:hypothetical protein